jgi:hypothetical protein
VQEREQHLLNEDALVQVDGSAGRAPQVGLELRTELHPLLGHGQILPVQDPWYTHGSAGAGFAGDDVSDTAATS